MFSIGTHRENVDTFMQDEFSVDKYLSKYEKGVKLETVLRELGEYLETLKLTKLELINQDCEQFIYLVLKVVEINEKVNSIQNALLIVKQDALNIKDEVGTSVENVGTLLQNLIETRNKIEGIQNLECMQKCLNQIKDILVTAKNNDAEFVDKIDVLERAVNQLNLCQFYINSCRHQNNPHLKNYALLSNAVLHQLNAAFLYSLKTHDGVLYQCLDLYLELNKVDEAHELVGTKFVDKITNLLLNERSFYNEPCGIAGLYSKLVSFIDADMKPLLKNTKSNSGKIVPKEFDFLLNSFWPHFETSVSNNLKIIFALEDPNIFHKHYVETLKFLNQIEQRCGNVETVKRFRSLPSYQAFMRSWNLSVYFQLRFHVIAGDLEKILMRTINEQPIENSIWKLRVTEAVWSSLNICWREKIFLRQLSHRFWKLNMQILSRFSMWIKSTVDTISEQLPYKTRIGILVKLCVDIELLLQKVPELTNVAFGVIEAVPSEMRNNLLKTIEEACESIKEKINDLEKSVIDSILEETLPTIRQVNDIPRLFRRINRDIPTQPCQYVSSMLHHTVNFNNQYGNYVSKWLPSILSAITSQYYNHISEVLTSVQKTEESLRRFKKIRDRSGTESKAGNSDEDKIRMQLQIDIQTYIGAVEKLTEKSNVKKLQDLLNVIQLLKK